MTKGSETPDPDYARRVRRSFDKQGIMAMIGAAPSRAAPGELAIEPAISPKGSQQHGFVHAGAVAPSPNRPAASPCLPSRGAHDRDGVSD